MGHNEPLLGLVRGPRVLLTKAQPDLVLGLRVTILQMGSQFYGAPRWWGLGWGIPSDAHLVLISPDHVL